MALNHLAYISCLFLLYLLIAREVYHWTLQPELVFLTMCMFMYAIDMLYAGFVFIGYANILASIVLLIIKLKNL